MIKANYHTHNELCGHAVGKAKDYVSSIIAQILNVHEIDSQEL